MLYFNLLFCEHIMLLYKFRNNYILGLYFSRITLFEYLDKFSEILLNNIFYFMANNLDISLLIML